jgi:hypothetical protein
MPDVVQTEKIHHYGVIESGWGCIRGGDRSLCAVQIHLALCVPLEPLQLTAKPLDRQ